MLTRRTLVQGLGGLALAHHSLGARAQPADNAVTLTASPVKIHVRGADRPPTAAMAYNATVPGPLLRYRQGQEVRVRLVNGLDSPTAIHWAGYRIDNAMDGVPGLTQEAVPPGGHFDYRFMARDAGTYLYRPYVQEAMAAQIGAGLSGVFIVDEQKPPVVDQDHVFIFSDWTFDDEGKPAPAFMKSENGLAPSPFRPVYTLNGKESEQITVRAHQRIRLRLVNATGTRFIVLRSLKELPTLMAFDGQPCEPFLLKESLIGLAPGQRAELFIDISADADYAGGLALMGAADEWTKVVAFSRTGAPVRPQPLAAAEPLPSNGLPHEMAFGGALRAEVRLALPPGYRPGDAWLLNGRPLAALGSQPPLFKVKRGTVVQLAFVNAASAQATLHVHGHAARLLDGMDDGWKPFWLDTALAQPGQTARIAFRADNPGKWLLKTQLFDQPPRLSGLWFEVG